MISSREYNARRRKAEHDAAVAAGKEKPKVGLVTLTYANAVKIEVMISRADKVARNSCFNDISETDDSLIEITLRGDKETRDKVAAKLIKLIEPKGNNPSGELLDMGDGTSRLGIFLKGGSLKDRSIMAKMIEEEVRKLGPPPQKPVADLTIEEVHGEMAFYAANPPPYTKAQMKRGLELAQRHTDLTKDTKKKRWT